MREIYLDNSATTAMTEAVKSKMRDTMELYGNPSSLHPLGNAAHDLVEAARLQICETLGVRRPMAGELLFTSCGSEADNLAVLGCAFAKPRRRGMRVITTDSEHAVGAGERVADHRRSRGDAVVGAVVGLEVGGLQRHDVAQLVVGTEAKRIAVDDE